MIRSLRILGLVVFAASLGWAQVQRKVSDTLPLNPAYRYSDLAAGQFQRQAVPSPTTLSFSDSHVMGVGRKVVAESLTYGDQAVAVCGSCIQRTATDTPRVNLKYSDSVAALKNVQNNNPISLTQTNPPYSDSINRGIVAKAQDNFQVVTSVCAATQGPGLVENMGESDLVGRARGVPYSLSDNLSHSDNVLRQVVLNVRISDTLSESDSVSGGPSNFFRQQEDSLFYGDTGDRVASISPSNLQESFTEADSATAVPTVSNPNSNSRSFVDSLAESDAATRQASASLFVPADNLAYSDSAAEAALLNVSLTNSSTVTDAAVGTFSTVGSTVENFNSSDSVTMGAAHLAVIQDAMHYSDGISTFNPNAQRKRVIIISQVRK